MVYKKYLYISGSGLTYDAGHVKNMIIQKNMSHPTIYKKMILHTKRFKLMLKQYYIKKVNTIYNLQNIQY